MKDVLRIWTCPVEGCAKIGSKNQRCPDHNKPLRAGMYRLIRLDPKPEPANALEELMSSAQAIFDRFTGKK